MSLDLTFILLVGATLMLGLLAGASLDQSIKQLPARHRLGAVAFSQYSRAADLAAGVPFYGILGIGALLFSLGSALAAFFQGVTPPASTWLYLGAGLAVLHTLVTARAAPLNLSQRHIPENDEAQLARVLDKFTLWQNMRCMLQVIDFGVTLWALVSLVAGR